MSAEKGTIYDTKHFFFIGRAERLLYRDFGDSETGGQEVVQGHRCNCDSKQSTRC
jgi:hypothetical protein